MDLSRRRSHADCAGKLTKRHRARAHGDRRSGSSVLTVELLARAKIGIALGKQVQQPIILPDNQVGGTRHGETTGQCTNQQTQRLLHSVSSGNDWGKTSGTPCAQQSNAGKCGRTAIRQLKRHIVIAAWKMGCNSILPPGSTQSSVTSAHDRSNNNSRQRHSRHPKPAT